MDIVVAAQANCANIEESGKLNIMGIFDAITSPTFPVAMPFMVVALRFRVDYTDTIGEHPVVVALRDDDHREYGRATGAVVVHDQVMGRITHHNVILELSELRFSRPRDFTWYVEIDGEQKARIRLQVVMRQPGP